MMATTMVPPTAAPKSSNGPLRFVDVRAHLMPDEIISARQAVVVRKQVLIGLVVVVVLIVGWLAFAKSQTSSAKGSLSAAQRHGVELQSEQNQFRPLVDAQTQINATQTQLQKLMVADMSWKTMLTTLHQQAPAGVALTSITGTVTTGVPGSGTSGTAVSVSPITVGKVGDLTLTGTAPDKRSIAAYADALSKVTGLSAPLITNMSAASQPVTFTINVDITSAALGGRYAAIPSVPATSGGN